MRKTEKLNNEISDVFLSWNRFDESIVNERLAYLDEADISYYCSIDGSTIGFLKDIYDRIPLCNTFVLILSPNTLASSWCLSELVQAYRYLGGNLILPICFSDVFNWINKEMVLREDGERDNVFRIDLYDKDSDEEIEICEGFISTPKEVREVLDFLWNKVGTLYAKKEVLDSKSFVNAIRNIVIESALVELYDEDETLDIKQIFTNVELNLSKEELDDLYIKRYLSNEDNEQLSENDVVNLIKDKSNLLIYSDAGNGKTELTKRIKNKINLNDGYVASFMKCTDIVSSKEKTIFDYLFKTLSSKKKVSLSENHLKGLLGARNFVLFLDGFDEVVEQREKNILLSNLIEFINEYKKVRVVITSRFKVKDNNLKLINLRLNGFSDDDINDYTNKLYIKIPTDASDKGDIYIELEKVEREIKTNPFFLTQLIFIYKLENIIPKTKYEILEKTSSYIIDIDKNKIIFDDPYRQRRVLTIIQVLLPYLAYAITYEKKNNAIDEYLNNNLKGLYSPLEIELIKSDIITFLEGRSIVLNDAKKLNFLPSFIDYYAAEYVYSISFDNDGNNNDNLLAFLDKHHDKNELISMLLCKIDNLYHQFKIRDLERVISLFINHFVDSEIIFNLAHVLYTEELINEIGIKETVRRIINNKENYYHELFYYLKQFKLDRYLDDVLYSLIKDESVDKMRLISLYRDYSFIILQKHKINEFDGDIHQLIEDFIKNNPSYRNALNAIFYRVNARYISDYINDDTKRIHPFFFNLYCVIQDDESDMMGDRILDLKFNDELHIYEDFKHQQGIDDVCYGLISLDYNVKYINAFLAIANIDKVIGIIFNNSIDKKFEILLINKANIAVLLLPSSIEEISSNSLGVYGLNADDTILYIEYGIKRFLLNERHHFMHLYMASSVIDVGSLCAKNNIKSFYFSNGLKELSIKVSSEAFGVNIKLPKNLVSLTGPVFRGINSDYIKLPNTIEVLDINSIPAVSAIFIHKNIKKIIADKNNLKLPLPIFIFEDEKLRELIDIDDISYINNVNEEDIIFFNSHLFIKKSSYLILLIPSIGNDFYKFDVPEYLYIDGIKYEVKMIDISQIINAHTYVYVPDGCEIIKDDILDYSINIPNKNQAQPKLVVASFDKEEFELSIKGKDNVAFVNRNELNTNKVLFRNGVLYYVNDDYARVKIIIESETIVLSEIIVDDKTYKVRIIDEGAIDAVFLYDYRSLSDREISYLFMEILIPTSIEIIEKQPVISDGIKGLGHFIITDSPTIPDGWCEEIKKHASLKYSQTLDYPTVTIDGLVYKTYFNSVALCNYIDKELEELIVPSSITYGGKEYPVVGIDEPDSYYNYVDKSGLFTKKKLRSVILPNSLFSFDSESILKSRVKFNKYYDGNYLGSEDNPYLVLVSNNNHHSDEFIIHPDTKIINILNVVSDRIIIHKGIQSINRIVYEIKNSSLYYDGSIEDFMGVNVIDSMFKGLKHFYYRNEKDEYATSNKLVIPASIKRIGYYKFKDASFVDEVVLENGVICIDQLAFSYSSIKKVYLPKSIKEIAAKAFDDCNADIYYNGTIEDFLKIKVIKSPFFNNRLYIRNNDEYILLEKLTIPSNVELIPHHQFMGISSIKEVHIPINCKYFGVGAFANCSSIQEVFVECINLNRIKDLELAFDLYKRKIDAVIYIRSHEPINEKLANNFYLLNDDDQIVKENGITYLIRNNEASVTMVDLNIRDIDIPASINGCPVISIDELAFTFIVSPKSVSLPPSLKRFDALFNWNKDSEVFNKDEDGNLYLGNKENPYLVLCYLNKEEQVLSTNDKCELISLNYLSNSKEVIKNRQVVLIPGEVKYINIKEGFSDYVLIFANNRPISSEDLNTYSCYFNVDIDKVFVKSDIIYIADDKDNTCKVVSHITNSHNFYHIVENIEYEGKTYNVNRISKRSFTGFINYSVVVIDGDIDCVENNSFEGNAFILYKGGKVPNSWEPNFIMNQNGRVLDRNLVVYMDDMVFFIDEEDELVLVSTLDDKDELYIKGSYKIGEHTFNKITPFYTSFVGRNGKVYLDKDIYTILFQTYLRPKMPEMLYQGNISDWIKVISFGSVTDSGCNIKILDENNNYIPFDKIEYVNVDEGIKVIYREKFRNCGNLKKITLPSSIEYIEEAAFRGCYNLEEVIINQNAHIKEIKNEAFRDCPRLNKITLPKNIDFIADNAFDYCDSLISVDLPIHLKGSLKGAKKEVVEGDIVHVYFVI